MPNLVVVESPAKQNKIQGFLGDDFIVRASYGHICDLPADDLNIDIANNFKPTYLVSPSKRKQVNELTKLANKSSIVWLATDDDREGEAIAWHLAQVVVPNGVEIKRIVFHEITKTAVRNAVKNPRSIDMNIFEAQQMRRILDRIIGYGQSEILWKAMQNAKSSGRVQSVVCRIVVEKEREIQEYVPISSIVVSGTFKTTENNEILKADYKGKVTEEETNGFLENCKTSDFNVSKIETKESKRKPPVPFITSTLQQEASSSLKLNSKTTMQLAQKLYEAGLITYMRTDSIAISDEAIQMCADTITSKFGPDYLQSRQYKINSKNAQEAHECIRPTKLEVESPDGIDGPCLRLYALIWKRTLASQMKDCLVDITTISIKGSNLTALFKSKGEVIKFDGFKIIYGTKDSDVILPNLSVNDSLKRGDIVAEQKYQNPPSRYSEGTLIKKLEDVGVGRPATYASMVTVVQERGYVVVGDCEGTKKEISISTLKESGSIKTKTKETSIGVEKKRLIPSQIGFESNDYLVKMFPTTMDLTFTVKIEEELDSIANGDLNWLEPMNNFYNGFKKDHDNAMEMVGISGKKMTKKMFGMCPQTEKKIIGTVTKYGPAIQVGGGSTARFIALPKDKNLDNITPEEVMKLVELPKHLGKNINLLYGKNGLYLKNDKGITESLEPGNYDITLEEAESLLNEKVSNVAEVHKIGDYELKKGKYGPYIVYQGKNYAVPYHLRSKYPNLTVEHCKTIIENKKK